MKTFSILVAIVYVFLARFADANPRPLKLANDNATIDDVNLEITGGQIGNTNQFPFMASIFSETQPGWGTTCGASILNSMWIITASHCVVDEGSNTIYAPNKISVRVGVNRLDSVDQKNVYQVAQVSVHPDYRIHSDYHDVALLKLRSPIQFKDGIGQTCIDYSERIYNYYWVAGYGGTSRRYVDSQNPRKTLIDEQSGNELKWAVAKEDRNAQWCEGDLMICTVPYYDAEDGGCYGDSGGPVVNPNMDIMGVYAALRGTPSNGMEALCVGKSMYIRLSRHRNFIDSHVGAQNYCSKS